MDILVELIVGYFLAKTGQFLLTALTLGHYRPREPLSVGQANLLAAIGFAFWYFLAWGLCRLWS